MNALLRPLLCICLVFFTGSVTYAAPDKIQLLVWANEAIVATYTVNYKTYLQEQKSTAKYFTTAGWIAYSNALNAAKLPEIIKKNAYDVTAVATAPPQLTAVDATHWTVVMPILVQYKNPQYQQQQYLNVTLGVTSATDGQGVRGFSITSLQSSVIKPPCQCSMPSTSVQKQ